MGSCQSVQLVVGKRLSLQDEYNFRWQTPLCQKIHASWRVIDSLPLPKLIDCGQTPFAQVMPDCYRNADAVVAYRAYYAATKQFYVQNGVIVPHKWTRRNQPSFCKLTKM